MLFIHSGFLLCFFFLFRYLTPKMFCFLCIRLLICPCAFSIDLLVEFSFLILFLLLNGVPLSFESPFFFLYLLIYFFELYGKFCLPLIFDFLFHFDTVYFSFFDIFACSCSFYISPSSLISYPYFVFLFGFWGKCRFYL